jgi:putative membrane protein
MQPAALTSFAREAAAGGMSEVELGRLAVSKATNPAVKAFGQRMIDDHSKANADLQSIAAQAHVTLPSAVDAKQKKTYDRLSALSGAAFDRAYIDDMVKDHKEDIAAFEKAAAVAGDSPIKQFAADKLPTLRDHLRMAQEAQAGLK